MELWAKLRQVFRQGGRALGASARRPGTKDLFGGLACTAWALQAVLAGLGGGSESTAPVCLRLERVFTQTTRYKLLGITASRLDPTHNSTRQRGTSDWHM